MGFYGRHYTYTVNDYFKTINFQAKYNSLSAENAKLFPDSGSVLTSLKQLTATVPAEGVSIASGNKWIQFVAKTANADMNNNNDIAYGLTIYHKAADGLVTDKLINFDTAAMVVDANADPKEYLMDGNKIILGYGKEITVNDLEFDEAGHAKGSERGTVSYALPKVVEKYQLNAQDTNPEAPLEGETYLYAYSLQDKIEHPPEGNPQIYIDQLNTKFQNYPFSAAAIIKPLYDNTERIAEHEEILHDGNDEVGRPGLIGQAHSLDSRVTVVENQIDNDILPALNLVPGIGKPGMEIDASKNIAYASPLNPDVTYRAGDRGTVLNHYDLSSLEVYTPVTFSDALVYVPNKFYDEDHQLAKTPEPDPEKQYYSKSWGNKLLRTNYAIGQDSLASGYSTNAFGDYAQAYNGRLFDNDTYSTTAYGISSHAEGHSDLPQKILYMGPGTDIVLGKIDTSDSGFDSVRGDLTIEPGKRHAQRVYVGLDATVDVGGSQKTVYKIYPASLDSNMLSIATSDTLNGGPEKPFMIYSSLAYGDASHIEGIGTIGGGIASHAEGHGTMALGDRSHAEGEVTFALGIDSHSEGKFTYAKGDHSHAEGFTTQAEGESSHAEGVQTIALGKGSHAEGVLLSQATKAEGEGSHAEGGGSWAQGKYSHAEGAYNGTAITRAQGEGSHAEGGGCHSYGIYSHAGGQQSYAGSQASCAQGFFTYIANDAPIGAMAVGKHNLSTDKTAIFMVGNGEATGQANAFTVKTDNSCEIAGNLKIEGGSIIIKGADNKTYRLTVNNGSLQITQE